MAKIKLTLLLCTKIVVATWMLAALAQPADDDLLWYSPDFEIKVSDLKWYMKSPTNADGEYLWEHPQKVQRAIVDLVTLRVLEVEADKAGVMSEAEKQWLASYRVAMAVVSRHLRTQAMSMMAAVNWEQAAKEYHLAHPDEFVVPEARTVRSFLLTLGSRTEEEALVLATKLAPKTLSQEDFRVVVLDNTEDQTAGDGLMENITRGQTVKPFEDAVFALTSAGEISDPIVSKFGVHVAQLIAMRPQRLQTFDEAEAQLIEELKQKRWDTFNDYLRAEPQRNPPAGVIEMTDNIDALLEFANQLQQASGEEQERVLRMAIPDPTR